MTTRFDLSSEQLSSHEVRPFANPPGYFQVALVCRACGSTVLVDEALRIDVVLGAIASDGALMHSESCPAPRRLNRAAHGLER